jgi:hypothetical protein
VLKSIKARNLVAPIPTPTPNLTMNPGDVLVTDTSYHTEEYHFPMYNEIYKTLNTGYFSLKDENFEVYQNIQKSGIHHMVSCPTLFPYNDAVKWSFKEFYLNTFTIVSNLGIQIASPRPEDINV